ncbi:MAG TPA: DUF6064 family protein [Gemmatimonadales bacterium]
MGEWWSYTLSDFLLFSPRAYFRLLERHNQALWPAQLLTVGLGFTILGLLARPRPWQGRAVSALLAGLWVWVAWAFLWNRYATINWAVNYLVPLFVLEAGLLAWIGVVRRRLTFRLRHGAAGGLGVAVFALALLIYPVIGPLAGRPWSQAEIFGIVPDPTVVGTLGLLLLAEGRRRWELMAVPLLWCAISGATLWAMHSVERFPS